MKFYNNTIVGIQLTDFRTISTLNVDDSLIKQMKLFRIKDGIYENYHSSVDYIKVATSKQSTFVANEQWWVNGCNSRRINYTALHSRYLQLIQG